VLIHGDGEKEMLVLPRDSSYLAIVVFAAAFDSLSTIELDDFSSAVDDFEATSWSALQGTPVSPSRSGCLRWGIAHAQCQWPLSSVWNLAALCKVFGVPLANGYPLPAIVVTDEEYKVRYFTTFQPVVGRIVEETLRVVAAEKEVDEAKGNLFTSADWVQGEPTITNIKAGVVQFYKERHREEEQEKSRLALLQARLQQFYNGVFGSSETSKEEVRETRRKLEAKVASIVEEATWIRKAMEEERGEAKEKQNILMW